jgi:anti-sigma regulatory factor (Ser/Thr protein kinase)
LTIFRRELVVPADLSRLPEVRAFAEEVALECGFSPDDRYAIKSSLNEAVANAVEHGSHAPDDEVRIEAATEAGSLVLYVRDTGTFRPRVWRGGEISERGRGLDFIGRLMDEVDVRPGRGGTEVRMVKRF